MACSGLAVVRAGAQPGSRNTVGRSPLVSPSPPLSNTVAHSRVRTESAQLSVLTTTTLPLNWAERASCSSPTGNMSKFTGLTCRYCSPSLAGMQGSILSIMMTLTEPSDKNPRHAMTCLLQLLLTSPLLLDLRSWRPGHHYLERQENEILFVPL